MSDQLVSIPSSNVYRLLNHGATVLVSTTDGVNANVCTVAWISPCLKSPPRFSLKVGTRHKTYENLASNKILGLNIPLADDAGLVMYCGTRSGYKIDKIADRPIELFSGSEIPELPLLKTCAAWLECRVIGEAEVEPGLLVVEAVAARTRPDVLREDGTWNQEDFPTLHHLGGRRFLTCRGVQVV
jgi:flavin reductase (DIM6/NTAB) family NADH-FMN oxidoreductase RutF